MATLQQQQVSRTRDSGLTTALCDTAHTGRTMQYYGDLEKKIAALTPEQVNDALRKHLNADKLVVVSAGDFRPGIDTKAAKPEAASRPFRFTACGSTGRFCDAAETVFPQT